MNKKEKNFIMFMKDFKHMLKNFVKSKIIIKIDDKHRLKSIKN